MGKALRLSRRGSTVSGHGTAGYPYSPKRVHPRSKPIQRTPYSASDLRRLFTAVNAGGQNGSEGQATLARRAAASLERLLARLMNSSGTVTLEPVLPLSTGHGAACSSDDEGSMRSWTTDHSTRRERQLKRLGFVLAYGEYYYNWGVGLVSSVYATGRAFVPSPLDGVAGSLEGRVAALSMPVIAAVQGQSEKMLQALDARIDGVLVTAAGVAAVPAAFLTGKGGAAGSSGGGGGEVALVMEAKNAYLSAIEDALLLIKEKGLTGSASYAADMLLASVGRAKEIPPYLEMEAKQLMIKVGEAWSKLAGLPPVSLLQPSVEYTWAKYLAAHDAVVATPTYNKAVDLTAESLGKVQGSYMYKALYPRISPYADPALGALASTQTYAAIVDHLRPVGA